MTHRYPTILAIVLMALGLLVPVGETGWIGSGSALACGLLSCATVAFCLLPALAVENISLRGWLCCSALPRRCSCSEARVHSA